MLSLCPLKRFDSEKPLSHPPWKMEIRKTVFLPFCGGVLMVERRCHHEGSFPILPGGGALKSCCLQLPRTAVEAEGVKYQSSFYHLKRPWANGIPSQFLHPQIGSEGQSSFATGVKMKGGAIWTVSGIQLVSRMWAEKSLSSNATPTLHLQQCSMTLSDSFRDAGLPQHTTLGLQWWGGQVLNAHICAFIRLSLYMSWLAFNLPGHCIGLGLYTSFYGWTN